MLSILPTCYKQGLLRAQGIDFRNRFPRLLLSACTCNIKLDRMDTRPSLTSEVVRRLLLRHYGRFTKLLQDAPPVRRPNASLTHKIFLQGFSSVIIHLLRLVWLQRDS